MIKWLYFCSFAVVFFIAGCSSGSSSHDTNTSTTSFTSGGTFGSLAYKVVDFNGSTLMPYLGGWRVNNIDTFEVMPTSSNLPFRVYGGALTTYGDTYEVYGNAAVDTPVTLKYLLVPNLAVTPLNTPLNFRIMVSDFQDDSDAVDCMAQNSDGSLTVIRDAYTCDNIPLIPSVLLERANQAIEVEVNLGSFDTLAVHGFEIMQMLPNNSLTFGTSLGSISTTLNVNTLEPSPLPPDVIAYGDFRPTPDGFGFSNFGMMDQDSLTNEDIAQMYGTDRLDSQVSYTITASLQNIDGVLPMASRAVSQFVNSAVKLQYQEIQPISDKLRRSLSTLEEKPTITLETVY